MVHVEFRNTNTNEIRFLAPWLHITDDATLIERDNFAVDHTLIRQRSERFGNSGIAIVEILIVSRAEMHLTARLESDRAIPVQLQLVNPRGTLRKFTGAHEEHRLDELRFHFSDAHDSVCRIRTRTRLEAG
jgi:hypothetical protein